ncbi:AMP-binding protein, partial [Pseudoalteromonas sp. 43-MNA-CIBAN-0464]|uniref:AMP-binding protein n=1 Tax=Pseudoalteromonas sp. 43-MNA-CIBAN-0464 TaxID=3140425 RepID=UPI00331C0758
LSDLLPTLTNVIDKTTVELVISTHAMDLIQPQPQPETPFNKAAFTSVLVEGAKHPYQSIKPNHDDLIALQYTGGTTGLSKGAMLN